ncbi:MAG: DsbA family protein [Gammaproteobacteria bacterium]|nr:DsbA family protein [Gammaproteobacteria bacterium]
MNLRKNIRSRAVNLMLRSGNVQRQLNELKRKVGGRAHEVTVFLELDDPYSYLLSCYLPALMQHYDIEPSIRLTRAVGGEYRPMPELLAEYAQHDCRLLAAELGVQFLDLSDAPVVEHRRALLAVLAAESESDDFTALLLRVLRAYWRGDSESVSRLVAGVSPDSGVADALLETNQKQLLKLGHYNAATIFYGGEWYWGVDRLHYLVDRLAALGLRRVDGEHRELASLRRAMQPNLPMTVPASAKTLPQLHMYFSFRSPYSYLALSRIYRLADAFGLDLRLHPVLPMVQRGLAVPRTKILYILKDAKREADRLGVPVGKFCDPVGEGAERCIAVYYYALAQRRERDFCIAAGEAIFNLGIDVATDDGMRSVTEKVGLFWPEVIEAMADDEWRETAQRNRVEMTEAGVWGVPSFRIGAAVLWGQDRDWLLARQIEDMCADGDGILV